MRGYLFFGKKIPELFVFRKKIPDYLGSRGYHPTTPKVSSLRVYD